MYRSLINSLKQQPFFLALLPVFFIYSGYNELFGFLSPLFVLLNAAWVITGIAVLYVTAWIFFRNRQQAALFTFFVSAFLLLFGFLHDVLKKAVVLKAITSYTFILPLVLLLVVLFAVLLKRKTTGYTGTYLYLNVLMLALLLSEIPNTIKRYRLDKSVHNLIDFRFTTFQEFHPPAPLPDSLKPDIYFLVFDAMASSASLRETMNKDNTALDSFLRQQGFYVIQKSSANYNWTIHSISTTLNMQYLPEFIAPVMHDPKAYFWGSASILNNSLTTILRNEGYRISQYQPISFSNPDWPYRTFFHDLQAQHFFFKTFPGRIYKDIFWNYTRVNLKAVKSIQASLMSQRNQARLLEVQNTMRLIKQSCSGTGTPRFIYGHFMLPHDPYTFDRTGKLLPIDPDQPVQETADEPAAYFEQVLFANRLIEEAVTYIRQNNRRNTVIVVAGDHGYKYYKKQQSTYTFQNLNAVYFPDHNYSPLYDSLSPVNTFRVILNKYFRTDLPLLKDSSILVTEEKETIIRLKKTEPVHSPSIPGQR